MRAVVFDRTGPPEVLRVVELPDPRPAPGQVRVRVRAAGIQPVDILVRQGAMPMELGTPQQLGNEFAGVIDQVGDGAGAWTVGEQVIGWANMASLAEWVVVDTDAITAKPAAMSWQQAGALGASGQTALTALSDLRVGPGDTLLIHAAAGGAGTMAVQIARHHGTRVIGTTSPANHAYATSLGAIPLTYGEGLVDRVRDVAPDGIDAALDAVGGQALRDSLALVDDRDRIGTLVEHHLADQLGVRGIRARRSTAQLRELVDLHEMGAVRVHIRAAFGLDEIVDAHREVERGHGRGKVVVTMEDVSTSHFYGSPPAARR